MAITAIEIIQDNIVDGSNLVPVHSPVVFLVNATYTTTPPLSINVDIISGVETLDTYKCIPYQDLAGFVRQFAFIADEVIRSYMDSFEDELQLVNTLEYIEDITKLIELVFYDPDVPATSDSVTINFVHGAAQFGAAPNFEDIYDNVNQSFEAPLNGFVYVYFYNNNASNVLSIGPLVPTLSATPLVLDYGNEYILSTYTGLYFTITAVNITGNITITAPANFQVSLSELSGYADQLVLTPVGGNLVDNIYVSFSPTEVIGYDANVVCEAASCADVNVNVKGYGDELP